MSMSLALLTTPLAPVLDGHWLVGLYHIGDLQFWVDLEVNTRRINCYVIRIKLACTGTRCAPPLLQSTAIPNGVSTKRISSDKCREFQLRRNSYQHWVVLMQNKPV